MRVYVPVYLIPASPTADPDPSERTPMATPCIAIRAQGTAFRAQPSKQTVVQNLASEENHDTNYPC